MAYTIYLKLSIPVQKEINNTNNMLEGFMN